MGGSRRVIFNFGPSSPPLASAPLIWAGLEQREQETSRAEQVSSGRFPQAGGDVTVSAHGQLTAVLGWHVWTSGQAEDNSSAGNPGAHSPLGNRVLQNSPEQSLKRLQSGSLPLGTHFWSTRSTLVQARPSPVPDPQMNFTGWEKLKTAKH